MIFLCTRKFEKGERFVGNSFLVDGVLLIPSSKKKKLQKFFSFFTNYCNNLFDHLDYIYIFIVS